MLFPVPIYIVAFQITVVAIVVVLSYLQNAFLEEETEDQMFRLFAHVSLTRDPRATRDMVPSEVWANLVPDPEIAELEERRAELKQGQYRIDGQENEAEIRELTAKIRSNRSQGEKKIVKEYRENYVHHRPTWDLAKQFRGEEPGEYAELAIDLVIPERAQLAEIFCHQPDTLSDEEMTKLSIEVIDLYVALCGKRETVKCFSSLSYSQRLEARPSGQKLHTRHIYITQRDEQVRFV